MMSAEVFGVNGESLTNAICGMERDLNLLRPHTLNATTLADVRFFYTEDRDAQGFHDSMQGLDYHATSAIAAPTSEVTEPRTKFGKTLLTASKTPDLSVFPRDATCIQSELRLMRSLRFHNPANITDKGYAGSASIIILDEQGTPIGYEKSSGTPSTYMWAPTLIKTRRGRQAVAGDSFNFLHYREDIEDVICTTKAGLIAVKASIDTIEMFGMARLSARCYPPTVRKAAAVAAVEMEPKLSENIDAALTFKPSEIKRRVDQLFASGLITVLE